VYAEALPTATHQVLTEVRAAPEGDAFYPEHDRSQWRETRRERHPETDPAYEVVWLERRDR
jgi:dihydrofolate reductase